MCPDGTEPTDSDSGGFTIELIGSGDTDQDPEDAFPNYMGVILELDDDNQLKLTSTCETGMGSILSIMMDVNEITEVNVTYVRMSAPDISQTVKYQTSLFCFLALCFSSNNNKLCSCLGVRNEC